MVSSWCSLSALSCTQPALRSTRMRPPWCWLGAGAGAAAAGPVVNGTLLLLAPPLARWDNKRSCCIACCSVLAPAPSMSASSCQALLPAPVLLLPATPAPEPCNACSTAASPRHAASSTTRACTAATAAVLLAAGPVGALPPPPLALLAADSRSALHNPTAMPGRKKARVSAACCATAELHGCCSAAPPATAASSCCRACSAAARMARLPLLPRCASASAACRQSHMQAESAGAGINQYHNPFSSSSATSQPHLQQQRGEVAQQRGCRLIQQRLPHSWRRLQLHCTPCHGT